MEWLGLIVFESDRCLRTVLFDLRSMSPAERQALAEHYESHWPPFDLIAIEAELACLVEEHGDAITVADLGQLERVAA
jgi:hypothetical protein